MSSCSLKGVCTVSSANLRQKPACGGPDCTEGCGAPGLPLPVNPGSMGKDPTPHQNVLWDRGGHASQQCAPICLWNICRCPSERLYHRPQLWAGGSGLPPQQLLSTEAPLCWFSGWFPHSQTAVLRPSPSGPWGDVKVGGGSQCSTGGRTFGGASVQGGVPQIAVFDPASWSVGCEEVGPWWWRSAGHYRQSAGTTEQADWALGGFLNSDWTPAQAAKVNTWKQSRCPCLCVYSCEWGDGQL